MHNKLVCYVILCCQTQSGFLDAGNASVSYIFITLMQNLKKTLIEFL